MNQTLLLVLFLLAPLRCFLRHVENGADVDKENFIGNTVEGRAGARFGFAVKIQGKSGESAHDHGN